MGTFSHHMLLGVIGSPLRDDEIHSACESYRNSIQEEELQKLVVGPVTVANGFVNFGILPDGSKVGWEYHTDAAALRARTRLFLEELANRLNAALTFLDLEEVDNSGVVVRVHPWDHDFVSIIADDKTTAITINVDVNEPNIMSIHRVPSENKGYA